MISLIDFWRLKRRYDSDNTEVKRCHIEIASALTKLVMGYLPTQNLLIMQPPRTAKTDLAAKAFIPWSMSPFPDSEYIVASYGSDLASEISVDVRDTLSSDWYRSTLHPNWGAHILMAGNRAAGQQDYFHTKEGGCVKAVGVGGGITGYGAGKLRKEWGGCIVIDDPLKANDRRSQRKREECIDWYHGTLESRRNRLDDPQTPIVLIMQRLHSKDLAGHLLQTEREKWTVIQIPALNEEGESIWPGRIGKKEMQDMEEADPEKFWAQYMQNPGETSDVIFKESWWRYWG